MAENKKSNDLEEVTKELSEEECTFWFFKVDKDDKKGAIRQIIKLRNFEWRLVILMAAIASLSGWAVLSPRVIQPIWQCVQWYNEIAEKPFQTNYPNILVIILLSILTVIPLVFRYRIETKIKASEPSEDEARLERSVECAFKVCVTEGVAISLFLLLQGGVWLILILLHLYIPVVVYNVTKEAMERDKRWTDVFLKDYRIPNKKEVTKKQLDWNPDGKLSGITEEKKTV